MSKVSVVVPVYNVEDYLEKCLEMCIRDRIDTDQLLASAASYGKSPYGEHLRTVASGNFVTSYNK